MDLDLIRKLIRLANNNPNDNEANLAARKACKLIEQGKVFETLSKIVTPPNPPRQGPVTWNDVQRSTEPWNYRPRPNESPRDFVEELLKQMKKERDKQTAYEEQRKQREEEQIRKDRERNRPHPGTHYYTVEYEYGPPDYGTVPPPPDSWTEGNTKKILRCMKCGQPKPTRFRGLPDTYVCMECRGAAYQEDKK